MIQRNPTEQLFHEYFKNWIETYKLGAVRQVTYNKYLTTLMRLKEIAPDVRICELDKMTYQGIINNYANTHEKQTTFDFHRQLKGVILDMVDDNILPFDPTRKAVIKGTARKIKKPKFLNQKDLQKLLSKLELESPIVGGTKKDIMGREISNHINWDWLILLLAKTGLRFAEAIGLTPKDFDFKRRILKVSKTWDYKSRSGGFGETKNLSSKRSIKIDEQLNGQFFEALKNMPKEKPIFAHGRVFNSVANQRLKALCKKAKIPVITIHGLRHTHASLLIFAGVSIASVAQRL